MLLKELELGSKTKCKCESCDGTGLYAGFLEQDGLAVICSSCNGTGYHTLRLNDGIELVQDERNGVVYEVIDGIIENHMELFDKLQKIDNIRYVMYGTGRRFSPSYLFKHGASEVNVITYQQFLDGELPLPIPQYTCPGYLVQKYGDDSFDCDFTIGAFSDCKKYGSEECWEKFYGKARTTKTKQKVLRGMKHN